MHRGDCTHRGLGGVIGCTHRGDCMHSGLGGVIVCTGVIVRTGGDCVHRGDGTHRGLGGVIVRTHRGDCTHRGDGTHSGLGGVIVCMDPTGVVVRVSVLQGVYDVHGSYRGYVTCMGPTGQTPSEMPTFRTTPHLPSWWYWRGAVAGRFAYTQVSCLATRLHWLQRTT